MKFSVQFQIVWVLDRVMFLNTFPAVCFFTAVHWKVDLSNFYLSTLDKKAKSECYCIVNLFFCLWLWLVCLFCCLFSITTEQFNCVVCCLLFICDEVERTDFYGHLSVFRMPIWEIFAFFWRNVRILLCILLAVMF